MKKLDLITLATKKKLNSKNKRKNDFEMNETSEIGPVYFDGSKNIYPRVLRLIDKFIKSLKKRNVRFKFSYYGSYIIIENLDIQFYIKEKNQRVKFINSYGREESKLEPTGRIRLNIIHNLSKRQWIDGKASKLENKIEIIADQLIKFA
ncbi:hypothetical protein, partial [Christiangramia aquimixticola]|uniref:hypothetical protein n=1 Tax=Christiangramia aquimixticola TaxID=1697558 RepID=UPI003AA7EABB